MAIVSESMLYQERIAPSYVSSSGYYGYVPPTCPFANYESSVVIQPCNSANEAINETSIVKEAAPPAQPSTNANNHWTITEDSTLLSQYHKNHNDDCMIRKYDSAMETDDDETLLRSDESLVGVSRCQNNRCVIPEAGVQSANIGSSSSSSSFFSTPSYGRYESFYRFIEEPEINAVTKKRGNRKRNSAGDPAYLIDDRSAPNFTKKSRKETVVTATFAMVQEVQENVDRPRCVMSRHY